MNPDVEQDTADEIRRECNLDYSKVRPNRFAGQVDKSQVVVMLDADISEVVTTPESVNAILRALIKTMPTTQTTPARKSSTESTRQPSV